MLGYWRDYVPDFAARTEKLRRLLSKDAAPWTAAHTEEFKAVVAVLVASAPMINFDPTLPVVMEPHSGPKGVATVYLQQDPAGGRWLPVAAYSRALKKKKKRVRARSQREQILAWLAPSRVPGDACLRHDGRDPTSR